MAFKHRGGWKMEIRRGNHRLENIVLRLLCSGTGIWAPKGVQLRQGGCHQERGGLGEGLRQLFACEWTRMPGMEQASGQHPASFTTAVGLSLLRAVALTQFLVRGDPPREISWLLFHNCKFAAVMNYNVNTHVFPMVLADP